MIGLIKSRNMYISLFEKRLTDSDESVMHSGMCRRVRDTVSKRIPDSMRTRLESQQISVSFLRSSD